MKRSKWITKIDNDGQWLWIRKLVDSVWQAVRIQDMWEFYGEDECARDDVPRYSGDVLEVDLDTADIYGAIESCCCDAEKHDLNDDRLVEMCISYGTYSPMGTININNYRKTERQLKALANELYDDADAREEKLETVVNGIGQTAREYAAGDVVGDLKRKLLELMDRDLTDAGLAVMVCAKMYGMKLTPPPRPDDWLPYMCGYMDALQSRSSMEAREAREDGVELAPEYYQGSRYGTLVGMGIAHPVGWISTPAKTADGYTATATATTTKGQI